MASVPAVHHKEEELTELFTNLDVENRGYLSTASFTETLETIGMHEFIIKKTLKFLDPKKTKKITLTQFLTLNEMGTDLVQRALSNKLILKDFTALRKDLEEMATETEKNKTGLNAQYIPQLADNDPEQFAVAFCSVDGQYWDTGDIEEMYTIQSTSKPFMYCMVNEVVGQEKLSKHVGQEPSGMAFNAFVLDKQNRPHNPMINLGAIMTCSLLYPRDEQAKRFQHVTSVFEDLANSKVSFDNATYLSEFEHASRNYSLAYMAQDAGAFDANDVSTHVDITKQLQFYFMCCSVMVNTEQASIIAASLANGGINPLSGKRVFSNDTVRDCLSLMYSCGMYDYSGQFAFKIGLPAKSGVSGVVMLVIPDVAGVAIYSPRLDGFGNSVRGVEFCTRLTKKFPFHVFDTELKSQKENPVRTASNKSETFDSFEMIFASAAGDLNKIISLVNRKVSVNCSDYDGRTPLHLATCEGRMVVAGYLLKHGAKLDVKDRWGKTPMDEADGKEEMKKLLQEYQ